MMRLLCILLVPAASWGNAAVAQEHSFQVTDMVELPEQLTGQRDPDWYLELDETWTISANGPVFTKSVSGYRVFSKQDPDAGGDSLQSAFREMIRVTLSSRRTSRFDGITCEFMLREDPGQPPGELQRAFIPLISRHSATAARYDLEQQLNSVHFHEEWTIDPASFRITRRVTGIDPVIWQRRKTTGGEPVDDAESGLPVYYKIRLEQIPVRNRSPL